MPQAVGVAIVGYFGEAGAPTAAAVAAGTASAMTAAMVTAVGGLMFRARP